MSPLVLWMFAAFLDVAVTVLAIIRITRPRTPKTVWVIALVFAVGALVSFASAAFAPSIVAPDGSVREMFGMIPVGYTLTVLAVIVAAIGLIATRAPRTDDAG